MIISNIFVFGALSALAAGSETPDESYPDDGRTRIVETSRFGTLRRKPLPQCIQDRIRNRRYFPAGDYTEEARRACERFYREHPERRPPGWRAQGEQLPVIQEETTGEIRTVGETSDLGSISLDLSKGDLNALDALGLSIEDLEVCCPLDEDTSTDGGNRRREVDLDSTSPPSDDSDIFFPFGDSDSGNPALTKVEHEGRNVTQPALPIPRGSSESDHSDSDDENGGAVSSYPPPTPANSPRVSRQGDEAIPRKAIAGEAARGNGLRLPGQ